MSALPPPPVPAECTMGGNDWFPWYFDRLRKSKWWRRATDMARARNVMLWGEAYKANPAGSLPDDDDELAEAAGFGMDVESFVARKSEIMAPWQLCSDGRWYHPTVCEVVLERWESTSEKRRAAAAKKRAQREKARGVPTETAAVPTNGRDVPGDIHGNGGDSPASSRARMIGHDTTDKTERTPHSPPGGDNAEPKPKPLRKADVDAIWNSTPRPGRERSSKADLERALRAALSRGHEPEAVLAGVRAYYASAQATKNGGEFAKGVHRIVEADRWQSFADPPAFATVADDDLEASRWRSRLREFAQNRWWEELNWGPKPGKPGCEAPAAIQREFGFAPASEIGDAA